LLVFVRAGEFPIVQLTILILIGEVKQNKVYTQFVGLTKPRERKKISWIFLGLLLVGFSVILYKLSLFLMANSI
jgi:hypothetical protein